MDIAALLKEFSNCPCGKAHTVGIRAVEVGSGLTRDTGGILERNGFGKRLLLVADRNTLAAAEGLVGSLNAAGFCLTEQVYDDLRVAEMREVERIEGLLGGTDGVIAVGTGSIHDICRLAAARRNKPLCVFATAASMDGFASDTAPITDRNFKVSYPAKTPEVIVADTKILAAAPAQLKAAGLGDMMGKYVGLIDWQVSHLIINEYYCPKVADLTRRATDAILGLADRVQAKDEAAAREVFEALLLTGVGMAFAGSSRPASGTEHILSHYWECVKLTRGELSDFHGKKVGVATLLILEQYGRLAKIASVRTRREQIDWEEVYRHYGILQDEVRKLNSPTTITDGIDPQTLANRWPAIREIIRSVPCADTVRAAMQTAGCATECHEIGVTDSLKADGLHYHPFMRRRLSLMRLTPMLK